MREPMAPRLARKYTCDECGGHKTSDDMAWAPLVHGKRGHICERCDRRERAYYEQRRRYPRGLKGCGGCGRLRPLADFREELRHRDGLEGSCTDCRNRERREHREETPLEARRRIAKHDGEQTCSGECGETLPLARFERRNDSATGYRSVCRDCVNRRRRAKEATRRRLEGLEAEEVGTCWCCGEEFPTTALVEVEGQTECPSCHDDLGD